MVHTGGHSSSVEWRKKDPATAVLEGLEVVWEACLLFWGVQAAQLFVRGILSPMRRQQVPPQSLLLQERSIYMLKASLRQQAQAQDDRFAPLSLCTISMRHLHFGQDKAADSVAVWPPPLRSACFTVSAHH